MSAIVTKSIHKSHCHIFVAGAYSKELLPSQSSRVLYANYNTTISLAGKPVIAEICSIDIPATFIALAEATKALSFCSSWASFCSSWASFCSSCALFCSSCALFCSSCALFCSSCALFCSICASCSAIRLSRFFIAASRF